MISELDIIRILKHLEKNETAKARDVINNIREGDSDYDKGYLFALKGMIASCENEEKDSLFYKLMHSELSDEITQRELQKCKEFLRQDFRESKERGYEHAWSFVLSYFRGEKKTGLDIYQE
ncbi:MAG: hypothetical protein ACXQTP_00510 [Candidatus Methanofastidiosia archaeon]